MPTLGAFVAELLVSALRLVLTMLGILVSDPLSTISLLVGAAIIGGASLVLGALALGAAIDWVADLSASPGGGPRRPGR